MTETRSAVGGRAVAVVTTLAALAAAGSLCHATDKCGLVCNETWTAAGNPYTVTCDVTVTQFCSLTIEAGTEVRFQIDTSMLIPGDLDVNGTAAAPVLLTSDAAAPQRSDWGGLFFFSGGTGDIAHATVEYSANGLYVRNSADVTVAHSTLSDNSIAIRANDTVQVTVDDVMLQANGRGFSIIDSAAVTITGSTITGCYNNGIFIGGTLQFNPSLTITGSSIYSNSPFDLNAGVFADPEQNVINARNNWWGSTNAATIAANIHDHRDDDLSPSVDSCDYLDGPGGSPVRDVHCPQLAVCGGIAVWDLTDKPYLLTSDPLVCPGATLRIESGVQVLAAPGFPGVQMHVDGNLEIAGTESAPVHIDIDNPFPQPGDWLGVHFEDGSTGQIDHAILRHAENGVRLEGTTDVTVRDTRMTGNINGAFVFRLGDLTLQRVTSRFNDYGLKIEAGQSTVLAADSAFTDNNDYGLWIWRRGWAGTADVTVTRSSLHSNAGAYDVWVGSDSESHIFWFPDNWWGTTDVQAISARIYDLEDLAGRPRVAFRPFGETCADALGADADGDGFGDFEDNCATQANLGQDDSDGDKMGDACDPQPLTAPAGACDGVSDAAEGYADADGDGWGDPCDFHPARQDSNPGAPELCDGRDNDGDLLFASGELTDGDFDRGVLCGECNDTDPAINACACENCNNLVDDDCDGATDGAQPVCEPHPYCVIVDDTGPELALEVQPGACGAGSAAGPFEVIRGEVDQLAATVGSVDLGEVSCVDGNLTVDRVTDSSPDPDPRCTGPAFYYLARAAGGTDFGSSSAGDPRDTMSPDPPCP